MAGSWLVQNAAGGASVAEERQATIVTHLSRQALVLIPADLVEGEPAQFQIATKAGIVEVAFGIQPPAVT